MTKQRQNKKQEKAKLLYNMRMTLIKVYTVVLVMTLIVGGAMGYYLTTQRVQESVDLQVALKQEIINKFFERERVLLERLAQQIEEIELTDHKQMQGLLESYTLHNERTIAYYIGLNDGSTYFGDGWKPDENYIIEQKEWYQIGKSQSDEVGYTQVYVDTLTEELVITLVRQIQDSEGNCEGVVATDLYLTDIISALDEQKMTIESYNLLLDHTGTVLGHENEAYRPKTNGITSFEVINTHYKKLFNMMSSQEKVVAYERDYDGKIKLFDIKQLENEWYMGVVVPNEAILREVLKILLVIITVILGVFILSYCISMWSVRKLVKPITKLASDVNAIARGQLTVQNDIVRDDEIGELAECINKMAHTMKHLIGEIQTITTDINRSIGYVNRVATSNQEGMTMVAEVIIQLAYDNTCQGEQFEEINGSMQEIMALFKQTQETSRKLVERVTGCSELAFEGMDTVSVLEGSTQKLNQSALQTMDNVNRFESKINEIHLIIDTIDELAYKTRLLSLNASIEAGRLGEDGKAFEVIAKEMSALAQRTVIANEGASEGLKNLQGEMHYITQETAAMMLDMDRQNQAVKSNHTLFETIKKELDYTKEQITTSHEMMSGAIGENEKIGIAIGNFEEKVVKNTERLQEMSAMTQEQLSNTTQIQEQLRALNEESDHLKVQINQFKVK